MSPFARLFIYAVIVADLFALVIFGGRYILTGSLLTQPAEVKIVVEGAGAPAQEGATAAAEAPPAFDYATYVADATKGEKIAAKCKACHTFDNGGPDRTGPNLFGIAGAPVAHSGSFAYSGAMTAAKGALATWTDQHLFDYLADPQGFIPGNKMQFNGIKNPAERADLVAWLKTLK